MTDDELRALALVGAALEHKRLTAALRALETLFPELENAPYVATAPIADSSPAEVPRKPRKTRTPHARVATAIVKRRRTRAYVKRDRKYWRSLEDDRALAAQRADHAHRKAGKS